MGRTPGSLESRRLAGHRSWLGHTPGIVGPRPGDRRTDAEEELLLEAGGTTFHVTRTGAVVLQRVVSSYLISDAGVADPAFHDIMEIKLATRIRHDWHLYFALTYPSNKLTDDGSLASQYDPTIVTPGRGKGSYAARMQLFPTGSSSPSLGRTSSEPLATPSLRSSRPTAAKGRRPASL